MRLKIRLVELVAFAALILSPAIVSAASPPTGCPGGPAGQAVPGTVCPDGSTPVKDGSLPLGCPGSSQQGPVLATYTAACPARPGRGDCTYSAADMTCKNAAGIDITNGDYFGTPVDANGQKIYDWLGTLINFLSALVGIAIVGSIVLGGIQYTTAGADPQKVSSAKGRVFNAMIALFAYIFIYAFLQWLVPGGLF